MCRVKYIIIVIFVLSVVFISCSVYYYEVVKNSCSNNTHCCKSKYYGVKANCSNKRCTGVNNSDTGELANYTFIDSIRGNGIGTFCPCQQANAFCNKNENICYCDFLYMPSIDRLRCIKRAVALTEPCEMDEQCQQKDFNSICDPLNKTCVCTNNFINIKNHCRSVIGVNFTCKNNADCFDNYGDYKSYCSSSDQCYCIADHIAAIDRKMCVSASQYYTFCFKDIQCTFNMGLGAKCLHNTCQCIDNYFLERKGNVSICSKKVERGQYCLTNFDCYQGQLNDSEQSLRCIYGECECKPGFYSLNNGDCERGNFAKTIMPTLSLIVFSYIVHIYIS